MDKNYASVTIGGKVITVGGNEDIEYIRKAAEYVDSKIEKIKKSNKGYSKLEPDMKAITVELNIVDDLFTTIEKYNEAMERIESLEKENSILKHELASCKLKNENLHKELRDLQTRV